MPHSRTARPHSVSSNKASGRRRTAASRAGCTPSTSCCLPRSSPAAAAARARAAWTPAPGLRRQRVQLRSVLIHTPTFVTCQALVNTSEHCHTVNQAMVPLIHTTSSGATQPDQRKPSARSSCCILGAQHSRVAKLRAVLQRTTVRRPSTPTCSTANCKQCGARTPHPHPLPIPDSPQPRYPACLRQLFRSSTAALPLPVSAARPAARQHQRKLPCLRLVCYSTTPARPERKTQSTRLRKIPDQRGV